MRKWIDSSLLLFLLLYSCLGIALGADHHVRSGASGSNDGSDWTNAWTGLGQVNWTRGDTYYVADGTYTDSFNIPDTLSGTAVTTIKKAVESEHGSATGWLSVYGDGQAIWTNSGISFKTNHFVVDGVTGGGPGSWDSGHGFVVDKSGTAAGSCFAISSGNTASEGGHATIRHVECKGNGGDRDSGVTQDGMNQSRAWHTDILIEYNYIHDVGRVPIFLRGNDITVQYNMLARNENSSSQHAEGMQITNGNNLPRPSNMDIRYNIFEDIEGTAVMSIWADDIRIYGNVILHTSWWGNHTHNDGLGGTYAHGGGQNGSGIVGGTSTAIMRDVQIYNNTIANFGTARATVANPSGTTGGNIAQNNLWYNCSEVGFTNVAHDYNYFVDSQVITETNSATGTGDPFTDLANLDFTLTSATPAGITLASPFNTDPVGVTRGPDGVWDRGAYEAGQPSPPGNLRVTQSSP